MHILASDSLDHIRFRLQYKTKNHELFRYTKSSSSMSNGLCNYLFDIILAKQSNMYL